jgi:nucleotide-binding universal stress UspA family protein
MYQRILVPIDGSDTSDRGLQEAIRMAQTTGAQLRLLHVMDRMSLATGFESYALYNADLVPLVKQAGEEILSDGSRLAAAAAGVRFDTRLIDNLALPLGEQVEECVNEWKADLVVIGTHGRRGFKRALMGSDAEQIMRLSPVPVLLVKGGGATVEKDAPTREHTRAAKTCCGACPCTDKQAA